MEDQVITLATAVVIEAEARGRIAVRRHRCHVDVRFDLLGVWEGGRRVDQKLLPRRGGGDQALSHRPAALAPVAVQLRPFKARPDLVGLECIEERLAGWNRAYWIGGLVKEALCRPLNVHPAYGHVRRRTGRVNHVWRGTTGCRPKEGARELDRKILKRYVTGVNPHSIGPTRWAWEGAARGLSLLENQCRGGPGRWFDGHRIIENELLIHIICAAAQIDCPIAIRVGLEEVGVGVARRLGL